MLFFSHGVCGFGLFYFQLAGNAGGVFFFEVSAPTINKLPGFDNMWFRDDSAGVVGLIRRL